MPQCSSCSHLAGWSDTHQPEQQRVCFISRQKNTGLQCTSAHANLLPEVCAESYCAPSHVSMVAGCCAQNARIGSCHSQPAGLCCSFCNVGKQRAAGGRARQL